MGFWPSWSSNISIWTSISGASVSVKGLVEIVPPWAKAAEEASMVTNSAKAIIENFFIFIYLYPYFSGLPFIRNRHLSHRNWRRVIGFDVGAYCLSQPREQDNRGRRRRHRMNL